MKFNKVEFKRYINECVKQSIRDILKEDKQLARTLVKEAIVDMFGERIVEVVGNRKKVQQPVAQPRRPVQPQRKMNVPAMLESRKQHTAPEASDGPKDLFEALVADTLINTLPDQMSGDKRNPKSQSWESLVTSEFSADDGPHVHLRQAAMTPNPVYQRAPQQYQQPVRHVVEEDNVPSQSQLTEMYRQKNVQPQRPPQPSVSDDLSLLGLGDKKWDHVIDAQTPTMHNYDLAALAAEMNSDLD